MTSTNRLETELLISLLERKRELWDVRHPSYQNRSMKESALHSIADDLKASFPNTILTSVKDVRTKIQNLRGQYRRELRLLESSKRSGAGAEEIKKPNLWFYEQLDFLKPFVEIRKGKSNLENSLPQKSSTTNDDHHYAQEAAGDRDAFNDSACRSKSKGMKKREANEALTKGMQDLIQFANTFSKPRRYEWFGEQMIEALNKFKNEDVADDTIAGMQRVLRQGQEKDKEVSNQPSTSTDILRQAMHGIIADSDIL